MAGLTTFLPDLGPVSGITSNFPVNYPFAANRTYSSMAVNVGPFADGSITVRLLKNGALVHPNASLTFLAGPASIQLSGAFVANYVANGIDVLDVDVTATANIGVPVPVSTTIA